MTLPKNNMPRIRFHDLRHSSATYLLSLGFGIKEISEWLGHGDIQTTLNIYSHIGLDEKTRMSEKLNERFKNGRQNGRHGEKAQ